MQYKITVTESQAHIIIEALDLYSRIGIGQFDEMVRHAPVFRYADPYRNELEPVPLENIRNFRDAIGHMGASYIGLPPNASFGIHHPKVDDSARVAVDILQVIRHRLAWDRNPKGSMGVAFDVPRQIAMERQPMPSIERVEEPSSSDGS